VHGIPTTGLRFFNVYGPRQDPRSPYSGVISIFCEALRNRAPVSVFGDGQQTRDFVYVADVVDALCSAMALHPDDAPVFNVCSGIATSVIELARTIAAIAGGMQPDIQFKPPRTGEIRHSLGDPTRTRAALGLGDSVALRDGLGKTLLWLADAIESAPQCS
jgi:UDP-glucose 4-epimerase